MAYNFNAPAAHTDIPAAIGNFAYANGNAVGAQRAPFREYVRCIVSSIAGANATAIRDDAGFAGVASSRLRKILRALDITYESFARGLADFLIAFDGRIPAVWTFDAAGNPDWGAGGGTDAQNRAIPVFVAALCAVRAHPGAAFNPAYPDPTGIFGLPADAARVYTIMSAGAVEETNVWNAYLLRNMQRSTGVIRIRGIDVKQTGSFVTSPFRTGIASTAEVVLEITPHGPRFIGKLAAVLKRKTTAIANTNGGVVQPFENVFTCFVVIMYQAFDKGGWTKNAKAVFNQILGKRGNRRYSVATSTIRFTDSQVSAWLNCAYTQSIAADQDVSEDVKAKSIATYTKTFSRTAETAHIIHQSGYGEQPIGLVLNPGTRTINFRETIRLLTGEIGPTDADGTPTPGYEEVDMPRRALRESVLLSGLPDFAIYVGYQKYVERIESIVSQLTQVGGTTTTEQAATIERMQQSRVLPSAEELASGRPDPSVLQNETVKACGILRGGRAYFSASMEALCVAGSAMADGNPGSPARPAYSPTDAAIAANVQGLWASMEGVRSLIYYTDIAKEGTSAESYIESMLSVGGATPVVSFIDIIKSRVPEATPSANLVAVVQANVCNIAINSPDQFVRAFKGNEYSVFAAICRTERLAAFVEELREADCNDDWGKDLNVSWGNVETTADAISADTAAWYP